MKLMVIGMEKPRVYVHRIGSSYGEYMTQRNEELLGSFSEVRSHGAIEGVVPPGEVLDYLEGASAILSLNGNGAEDITGEMLAEVGTVRVAVISHYYHGNHDRARAMWEGAGVEVVDASDGNNRAVAEWTLGAAITGMYRFAEYDRALKGGEMWPSARVADQVQGKVLGLVGLGRVGRIVARYFQLFDVEIIGYDAYLPEERIRSMGIKPVGLQELMESSDIISFHLPVTDETRGLIGRRELDAIRDGALVINSARAAILDGEAFREELKTGRFRAILDVYEPEPPPLDDVLRTLDNVVMTPHVAGNTRQMRADCGRMAIESLRDYLATGE
jgi:phosphoglycerate dehydrogenase-like enzyme